MEDATTESSQEQLPLQSPKAFAVRIQDGSLGGALIACSQITGVRVLQSAREYTVELRIADQWMTHAISRNQAPAFELAKQLGEKFVYDEIVESPNPIAIPPEVLGTSPIATPSSQAYMAHVQSVEQYPGFAPAPEGGKMDNPNLITSRPLTPTRSMSYPLDGGYDGFGNAAHEQTQSSYQQLRVEGAESFPLDSPPAWGRSHRIEPKKV